MNNNLHFINSSTEIDNKQNIKRNPQIEERIKQRCKDKRMNPYGGMGMDGDNQEVLRQKHEELDYLAYLRKFNVFISFLWGCFSACFLCFL